MRKGQGNVTVLYRCSFALEVRVTQKARTRRGEVEHSTKDNRMAACTISSHHTCTAMRKVHNLSNSCMPLLYCTHCQRRNFVLRLSHALAKVHAALQHLNKCHFERDTKEEGENFSPFSSGKHSARKISASGIRPPGRKCVRASCSPHNGGNSRKISTASLLNLQNEENTIPEGCPSSTRVNKRVPKLPIQRKQTATRTKEKFHRTRSCHPRKPSYCDKKFSLFRNTDQKRLLKTRRVGESSKGSKECDTGKRTGA